MSVWTSEQPWPRRVKPRHCTEYILSLHCSFKLDHGDSGAWPPAHRFGKGEGKGENKGKGRDMWDRQWGKSRFCSEWSAHLLQF